jgi:hypothetical protein
MLGKNAETQGTSGGGAVLLEKSRIVGESLNEHRK